MQVDGRRQQHVDALAARLERQQRGRAARPAPRPTSPPARSATGTLADGSRSSHRRPRTPAGPSDVTIGRRPIAGSRVQRPEVGAGEQPHLLLQAQDGEQFLHDASVWRRMRALLFDVFGTCVDWRTSMMREAERFGLPPEVAEAWRDEYQPQLETVRSGQRPWVNLDVLHRIGAQQGAQRLRADAAGPRPRRARHAAGTASIPGPTSSRASPSSRRPTSSRPARTATSPSPSTSPSTRSCRGTRSSAPRSPAPTSRTRGSTGRASTRSAWSRTRCAWSPRTATTSRRPRDVGLHDGVRRALRRGSRPAVRRRHRRARLRRAGCR